MKVFLSAILSLVIIITAVQSKYLLVKVDETRGESLLNDNKKYTYRSLKMDQQSAKTVEQKLEEMTSKEHEELRKFARVKGKDKIFTPDQMLSMIERLKHQKSLSEGVDQAPKDEKEPEAEKEVENHETLEEIVSKEHFDDDTDISNELPEAAKVMLKSDDEETYSQYVY